MAAMLFGLSLLVLVPPYYPSHPLGRPIYDSFKNLEPFSPILRWPETRILLGNHAGELAGYLHLSNRNFDYGLLASWNHQEELSDFLERMGITVAYFEPWTFAGLSSEPHARPLLLQPETQCWQRLGQEVTEGGEWLLIHQDRTRAECTSKP
jgi:hypothetical protein